MAPKGKVLIDSDFLLAIVVEVEELINNMSVIEDMFPDDVVVDLDEIAGLMGELRVRATHGEDDNDK